MKKINLLTFLITIISFLTTMESKSYNKYYHAKKNMPKIISFKPNVKFGDIYAQGQYSQKNQTATITYNDTLYSFKNIKRSLNPITPHLKNIPDLVEIGYYSTYSDGPKMPLTYYLFGTQIQNSSNDIKIQNITHQQLKSLQKNQSQVGQNTTTYAPVIFQPAEQFQNNGLIGNYFNSTNMATIHDPSGINHQSYMFKDVQQGGITPPKGLIIIGSYISSPHCNETICSDAFMHINLYGQQTYDE